MTRITATVTSSTCPSTRDSRDVHVHYVPLFRPLCLSHERIISSSALHYYIDFGDWQDRVALLLCLSDRRRPRGSNLCSWF